MEPRVSQFTANMGWLISSDSQKVSQICLNGDPASGQAIRDHFDHAPLKNLTGKLRPTGGWAGLNSIGQHHVLSGRITTHFESKKIGLI